MLEEECSLVEEVLPECREDERQECRLKEQESSSVEREQCWLGPVGKEVYLIKWLLSTVQIFFLFFANRARHFIY